MYICGPNRISCCGNSSFQPRIPGNPTRVKAVVTVVVVVGAPVHTTITDNAVVVVVTKAY